MPDLFDSFKTNYGDVVEDSIRFSGLKHDFFMQAKADLLARRFEQETWPENRPKPRALDIGCGIGTFHHYTQGLFASLDGCDISADSIARARREHPENTYKNYSGMRLPYDDNSFDFAFAVCVVHHVPPDNWAQFFSELFRVVSPGGLGCVIEHNPLNPATRLAVMRCPFDEDAVLLRKAKTMNLFAKAGFRDMSSEFFLVFPSANPLFRTVEKMMSAVPFGAQYASFGRV